MPGTNFAVICTWNFVRSHVHVVSRYRYQVQDLQAALACPEGTTQPRLVLYSGSKVS